MTAPDDEHMDDHGASFAIAAGGSTVRFDAETFEWNSRAGESGVVRWAPCPECGATPIDSAFGPEDHYIWCARRHPRLVWTNPTAGPTP